MDKAVALVVGLHSDNAASRADVDVVPVVQLMT